MGVKFNDYSLQVNKELKSQIKKRLRRSGEMGRKKAYDLSRVKTSKMRNSTQYEVEDLKDSLILTLGQGNRQIHYAKFQELGTKFFSGTHHLRIAMQKIVEEFKR